MPAVLAALTAYSCAAQTGEFIVSQHGQTVGTAGYSFVAVEEGYNSASLVRVDLPGLNYHLSKTERLTTAAHLRRVQLSATVNGVAVSVRCAPEAGQFVLNISAGGNNSSTRLPLHTAAVFLPDFDPGALETLLTVSAARNNRDLWAILPKKTGSVEAVTLATYADEQGTLDGEPIMVHHLVATIAGASTHLFSDPQNQLLQAELPRQGFALIRTGFVLTPPSKPPTPGRESGNGDQGSGTRE